MDYNNNRKILLEKAIEKDDVAAVKSLIEQGVELNPQPRADDNIHSVACVVLNLPLVHAVRNGASEEMINVLKEAGAQLCVPNIYKSSTLYFAAQEGDEKLLQNLLAIKNNPMERNFVGDTPLHAAVANGHVECCRLLIDAGAKVLAKNRFGKTPIQWFLSRYGKNNLMMMRGSSVEVQEIRRLLIKAGLVEKRDLLNKPQPSIFIKTVSNKKSFGLKVISLTQNACSVRQSTIVSRLSRKVRENLARNKNERSVA